MHLSARCTPQRVLYEKKLVSHAEGAAQGGVSKHGETVYLHEILHLVWPQRPMAGL